MKLKIKVTKEILYKSSRCGSLSADNKVWKHENALHEGPSQNCAIALACQEIFPLCDVQTDRISNYNRVSSNLDEKQWVISLPYEARMFIEEFDNAYRKERMMMNPIEFEVELNDDVVASINIDQLRETLKLSTTLELIDMKK